jgi:hypothetical protein
MGDMLGGVERRGGSSTAGTSHPLPASIDKKASHPAQKLARNPEAIEAAIAEPGSAAVCCVAGRRAYSSSTLNPSSRSNHSAQILLWHQLVAVSGGRSQHSRTLFAEWADILFPHASSGPSCCVSTVELVRSLAVPGRLPSVSTRARRAWSIRFPSLIMEVYDLRCKSDGPFLFVSRNYVVKIFL